MENDRSENSIKEKNMNEPMISVVIPMYNAEKYIEKAIMSVLNQTYSNLEIIVIDNCSTDHSVEIVRAISDNRILLYVNENNLGFTGNVNKGKSLAKGVYIKFLCADDILQPTCLEKLICYANCNEASLIYCNCNYIDGLGNFIYDKAASSKNLVLDYSHKNALKVLTKKYSILCCISFLFLKNEDDLPDFITIEGNTYNSDLVFLFDCFKKFGQLHYIKDRLIGLRRHAEQGTYMAVGTEIFKYPLMFNRYIIDKHQLNLKGGKRFRFRFNVFKNGCNAYLRYQRRIPRNVYRYTLKEFGFGYYILLGIYLPFVYLPKKVVHKIASLFFKNSKNAKEKK